VDEVEWWGAERPGRILAAWPLVRPHSDGEIKPPSFCYYIGPMFIRELRNNPYSSHNWNAYTECLRLMMEAIIDAHPRFAFSCPLGMTDLRALSWWNFDHSCEGGFQITPRYTARIDLTRLRDETSLLRSMSRSRRRVIAKWSKAQPLECDDVDNDRLLQLHDQTLRRTGGIITDDRHTALRRMADLARSGAGVIIGFKPSNEQSVEAAVILLDGPLEVNAVFTTVSEAHCKSGLPTWILWRAIRRAQTSGMQWFDMNGANSPKRECNTHSFGAGTELSFDCRFERR
jgi:hypothetical protein